MGVLIALLLPMLSSSQQVARQTRSLSNVRQIGLTTSQYAVENKELPPTLFRPVEGYWPPDSETVTVHGRTVRGLWFSSAARFHFAFSPALPAGVLLAPGSVPHTLIDVHGVATVNVIDYRLADCLYADPAYWDRWTQRGQSQFNAQRLSDIRFPSDKGLARQVTVYGLPGFPYEQQAALFAAVPSSVLWADLSATTIVQASLPVGEPNFYYQTPPRSFLDDGLAIDDTFMGIHGRDRNAPGRRASIDIKSFRPPGD